MRGKTNSSLNPEDARAFKRAEVTQFDPPEVARVLRAHRNTTDNSVPFMILGLLYVMLGASGGMATGIFLGFAGIRSLYTVCYLREIQPLRTISFAIGGLLTLVMMGDMVRLLLA